MVIQMGVNWFYPNCKKIPKTIQHNTNDDRMARPGEILLGIHSVEFGEIVVWSRLPKTILKEQSLQSPN